MQPNRQGGLGLADTHALVHSLMTDTELLASYLAVHDVPCPKCSYSLRGARSGECPECGTILKLTLNGDQRLTNRTWKIMWWGTFAWALYQLLVDLYMAIFMDYLVHESWESTTEYWTRIGIDVIGNFAWFALLVTSAILFKRQWRFAFNYLILGFFALLLGSMAVHWIHILWL